MLLLTTTTDKLQLVTGTAADVDVHASWVDNNAGTLTYGKTNTAITTATTTDIVPVPGASNVRNVKTIHIQNKDSTDTTQVTVLFDQNGTDFTLFTANLAPGDHLSYIEGIGWFETAASVTQLPPKASTADQTIGASVTVYLTNSDLALAGRALRAGTMFEWDVILTKTAAATASMTFDLRVGTTGTTSDTSRASLATGTQTAAADVAHLRVQAIVRTVSATGTIHAGLVLAHNLAATGFAPTANVVAQVTSGTFDTTATNLIFGLSLTTGASHSITVQNIMARASNILGAVR